MLTVNMDFSKLEEVIKAAVDSAIEKHSFINNLPPLLTRTQLMELLDIGSTKASELFNREDFPVMRELGHPRVPTHLLMKWVEQHTDWIDKNAGNEHIKAWRGGVA